MCSSDLACRERGFRYSQLIAGLEKIGCELDRRTLAEMAVLDPTGFDAVAAEVRRGLAAPQAADRVGGEVPIAGRAAHAGCSRRGDTRPAVPLEIPPAKDAPWRKEQIDPLARPPDGLPTYLFHPADHHVFQRFRSD